MDKPILLLDGDQYAFKAAIACEFEAKWDDQGNSMLISNANEAYDKAVRRIEETRRTLDGGEIRIAFSGATNFRKDIYPNYKGNRQNTRKPLCYAEVVSRLYEAYPCKAIDGLEADDLMGIWATRTDQETIIVSADKDMKTIPGKVYREGSVAIITTQHADHNFMFQTLIGDSTDGYPGCPGVGPKRADKIIGEAIDAYEASDGSKPRMSFLWPAVVSAYEKAGLTEDDALVQARLARILRASDWDAIKKEVILWTPS